MHSSALTFLNACMNTSGVPEVREFGCICSQFLSTLSYRLLTYSMSWDMARHTCEPQLRYFWAAKLSRCPDGLKCSHLNSLTSCGGRNINRRSLLYLRTVDNMCPFPCEAKLEQGGGKVRLEKLLVTLPRLKCPKLAGRKRPCKSRVNGRSKEKVKWSSNFGPISTKLRGFPFLASTWYKPSKTLLCQSHLIPSSKSLH